MPESSTINLLSFQEVSNVFELRDLTGEIVALEWFWDLAPRHFRVASGGSGYTPPVASESQRCATQCRCLLRQLGVRHCLSSPCILLYCISLLYRKGDNTRALTHTYLCKDFHRHVLASPVP